MKRIDDKIKEIEKKDKTNRWMFYGIIVLIVGFIYYASTTQKKINNQQVTISDQEKELAKKVDDLEKLNIKLNDTINLLRQSQTPAAFWNATTEAGITKSYLDYITHTGKPETEPEYIELAVATIKKDATTGKQGWIYSGKIESGKFIFDDNFAKLVWRANNDFSNLKPQKEDILINTSRNRYTYSNKRCKQNSQNSGELAWNKGVKVFVTDIWEDGPAIYVKIKF